MSTADKADLVVLGGALRAAELGISVVFVERDELGGTCLDRGCIPTKALLHTAEVADHLLRGGKAKQPFDQPCDAPGD